jgi:hypothetical protein
MKTRGSRAFAAMPGSVQEKAARFNGGKTRAVYGWLSGESDPSPEKQRMIEEAPGGFPAVWWREAAPDDPAPALPAASPVVATPGAIAVEADALLAEVARFRLWLSNIEGGDPGEKLAHLEKVGTLMVQLSKMRGVLMSERQIIDSPHWQALQTRVLDALRPWPDAIRAMSEALSGVES